VGKLLPVDAMTVAEIDAAIDGAFDNEELVARCAGGGRGHDVRAH
jgi:hypothetical protein